MREIFNPYEESILKQHNISLHIFFDTQKPLLNPLKVRRASPSYLYGSNPRDYPQINASANYWAWVKHCWVAAESWWNTSFLSIRSR